MPRRSTTPHCRSTADNCFVCHGASVAAPQVDSCGPLVAVEAVVAFRPGAPLGVAFLVAPLEQVAQKKLQTVVPVVDEGSCVWAVMDSVLEQGAALTSPVLPRGDSVLRLSRGRVAACLAQTARESSPARLDFPVVWESRAHAASVVDGPSPVATCQSSMRSLQGASREVPSSVVHSMQEAVLSQMPRAGRTGCEAPRHSPARSPPLFASCSHCPRRSP